MLNPRTHLEHLNPLTTILYTPLQMIRNSTGSRPSTPLTNPPWMQCLPVLHIWEWVWAWAWDTEEGVLCEGVSLAVEEASVARTCLSRPIPVLKVRLLLQGPCEKVSPIRVFFVIVDISHNSKCALRAQLVVHNPRKHQKRKMIPQADFNNG